MFFYILEYLMNIVILSMRIYVHFNNIVLVNILESRYCNKNFNGLRLMTGTVLGIFPLYKGQERKVDFIYKALISRYAPLTYWTRPTPAHFFNFTFCPEEFR